MKVSAAELSWHLTAFASCDGDENALLDALQALQDEAAFFSTVLIGRDHPGVLLRAAHHGAPSTAWLEGLDRLLGLENDLALRYERHAACKLAPHADRGRCLARRPSVRRSESALCRAFRTTPVRDQLRLVHARVAATGGESPGRGTAGGGMKTGKVWLVGAGPGDPELLTLKAVKAMRAADVMLVDDLVNDEALAFANPDARIIYVGKRGGCKSTPQAFIERLMVAEAKQGRTVVRLKGGDPFVFGRGGEECESLRAAGIDVEIINGITAGLAAPTSLGIPLTHRDVCHGAILVTGHAGDDATTAPDWQALPATGLPLVIYMGVSRCESIRQDLLDAGMRPSMPIAVIQNATRKDQRSIVTSLRALAHDIHAAHIGSPAIMVVGETVRYASRGRRPTDAANLSPPMRAQTSIK